MEEVNNYRQLIKNAPFGYAYHKIVIDNLGNPIDYVFIDVNSAFEKLTGLKAENIINKRITEVIPEIKLDTFDWIAFYGEIALNFGEKEFEQYSDSLKRWYKVQVNSSEKFYFTTFFTDITNEKHIINLSKQFLKHQSKAVDYQQIVDGMQAVSGAKYLAFNLFDENGLDFTTVALSGIKDHIKKAVELLGFKIIGKKWDHDPERAKKINSNIITRYKNLQELTGTVIYKSIVSVIEKTFKIGEVVVVKIMKGDIIVGDFTLLMPKGEFLKNDISVELFAQQVGLFIDRFNTEKELKLSEVKYRSLVNLMQVGVIIQGPKAEILYCNPKALELLGLSENQLLGKTSFDSDWNVIHEDGSPYLGSSHPVPLAIETRLPVMNAIMGVYRPVLHDRVWLLVDAEPQLDKKGNVQQIICTFIDISYRKQIESELKESEEKYRLLLENSGIGVGSFSLEGKILFFNQKALENLGGKAEDFIGKSLHDLYGEELATEYLNRFREAVQSEKNIEYEDIVPLVSGNRCFLSNYSKIKNYNGDIVGVQVLAHNITERKLAEKVLQKNLNILNETGKIAKVGGWELNLDTGIQSWTDETFRIFEMDVVKGSEPPLAESIELYAPVSRSIIADAVKRAIDYGESFDLQLQVITKKSNHIWVHAVGMANHENNKVLSLSGTIQNINEYKLVEEALLKTNAYLENLGVMDKSNAKNCHIPLFVYVCC